MWKTRGKCGWRRLASVNVLALALVVPGVLSDLDGCDFGEFTTTTTTTLDGREVVQFLVRSWILTPIEEYLDRSIDALFDKLEGEDAEE